jgi:hypothetical protein
MSLKEGSTTLFTIKNLSTSIKVYFGLVVALLAMHVTLTMLPVAYAVQSQAALASWPAVIGFVLVGFAGVWLSQKTGFPEMWGGQIPAGQRLVRSALLGAISGIVLAVLVNLVIKLPGQIHVPFPTSILYYAYGAIQTEILFHLFLIPLFLWLISSVLLKGRWQEQIFWGVAIVLSLLEPLTQVGGALQMGMLANTPATLIGLMFATIYGVNLASAYLFRKSGFLAPLAVRLSLYLVWHVIVGALVR